MGSTRVTLALLLCFAGPLDAQVGPGSCRPPWLRGGYFVPEKESYDSRAEVAYTCEKGRKPAAEGWWSTSLCQNGTWIPKPQCIDQGACLPPEITNANLPLREQGWYPHGYKIRVTCLEGYAQQNFLATAQCGNGTWSSVPVCTKRLGACDEPPRIPHAVVINRGHQEVFAEDSQVQYQCKEGYVMEGGTADKKSIFCISGKWTDVPTCTALCVLDAAHYPSSNVKLSGVQYLKEGEEREIPCVWGNDPHTSFARCTRGKVTLSTYYVDGKLRQPGKFGADPRGPRGPPRHIRKKQ